MNKDDIAIMLAWNNCKHDALSGQVAFMETLPWNDGLTTAQRNVAESIISQIHGFQDLAESIEYGCGQN